MRQAFNNTFSLQPGLEISQARQLPRVVRPWAEQWGSSFHGLVLLGRSAPEIVGFSMVLLVFVVFVFHVFFSWVSSFM